MLQVGLTAPLPGDQPRAKSEATMTSAAEEAEWINTEREQGQRVKAHAPSSLDPCPALMSSLRESLNPRGL